MATTTNYSWSTPDDTALVKDGASAIRTLGSSVDTTVKALNPETTLGDLAYRSSTANVKTRLGLGTAGQVLRVNSGATAPEWGTLSVNLGGYTLLNAGGTSLTGATSVTVSSLSGYNDMFIYIVGISAANGNSTIQFGFNSSATGHYARMSRIRAASSYDAGNFDGNSATDGPSINFVRTPTSASLTGGGYIQVYGANSTAVKPFHWVGWADNGGSNDGHQLWGGGYFDAAAVISSVTISSSSGNLDAGTVYIYGRA